MTSYPRPASNSDPATADFIAALLAEPIRPPKGVEAISYPFDRVPTIAASVFTEYPKDECWFNCVDYSVKHSVTPVFGWAIWQVNPVTFVAQHHTVVNDQGKLLDVTFGPQEHPVLFVPDGQAPFDFSGMRFPFNFQKSDTEQFWLAGEHRNPWFSIAKAPHSVRAADIISAGRQAGVI